MDSFFQGRLFAPPRQTALDVVASSARHSVGATLVAGAANALYKAVHSVKGWKE